MHKCRGVVVLPARVAISLSACSSSFVSFPCSGRGLRLVTHGVCCASRSAPYRHSRSIRAVPHGQRTEPPLVRVGVYASFVRSSLVLLSWAAATPTDAALLGAQVGRVSTTAVPPAVWRQPSRFVFIISGVCACVFKSNRGCGYNNLCVCTVMCCCSGHAPYLLPSLRLRAASASYAFSMTTYH